MKRRQFMKATAATTLAPLLAGSVSAASSRKRPNILYILIDDVSFGQMGNRKLNYVMGIRTPKINKLAEEGMSLMRMYTEPSCTPTRDFH